MKIAVLGTCLSCLAGPSYHKHPPGAWVSIVTVGGMLMPQHFRSVNRRRVQASSRLSGLVLVGLLLLTGSVEAQTIGAGNLVLGSEQTGPVAVAGNVTLNGTKVNGNLSAGRAVNASNCQVEGALSAGRDVNLDGCTSIKSLSTGRSAYISHSRVEGQVSAGRHLTLDHASIGGNVRAGRSMTLTHAEVKGTLVTGAPHLVINHSSVGNIRVLPPGGAGASVMHHSVVANGNTIISGSHVRMGGGGSLIRVGPGSTSAVNGFTVRANATQTTLMTPDNSIYVNRQKVHGAGPDTYSQYQALHPGAPDVVGPGWAMGGEAVSQADAADGQAPLQVVELQGDSLVSGNIVFEAGHGKVIVHPQARFLGRVDGGTLEKQ